jgi:hypothetical protein
VSDDYTVVWRRTISSNATPAWTAETEQYAPRR